MSLNPATTGVGNPIHSSVSNVTNMDTDGTSNRGLGSGVRRYIGPPEVFVLNRAGRAILKHNGKLFATRSFKTHAKPAKAPRASPGPTNNATFFDPELADSIEPDPIPVTQTLHLSEVCYINAEIEKARRRAKHKSHWFHRSDAEYVARMEKSCLANMELDRTVAVDEMRASIDRILQGLHACTVCTHHQIQGALLILLLQRRLTKDNIHSLTSGTYQLFDVKSVYYGDFVGKRISFKHNECWRRATIAVYNSFDGFVVQFVNPINEKERINRFGVSH
eukprot:scaffold79101_cov65-Phaeocystis_antarctica.AAC.4